jgi:hypothetical protein
MIDKDTERLWDELLDFIAEGRVIPVIGPELVMLDIHGQTTLLYSYLAKQLADRLQIDFEPSDSLNVVACRYLSRDGQREDIYPALKRVMPPLSEIKLPETLVKLAEIRPLTLFVSTSFDPLLAHVLNHVRYGGLGKTQVLAFSPGSNNDLPVALEQLDQATVFHLFGKLTVVPEYAVTDEDVLEFMHTLQSRTSRPERLFDALTKQNLMLIGCPLHDWLGRFFIRIGKKERLVVSSGKTDFMVGDQLKNETDLAEFVKRFSSRTKVFPMTSVEFVNELHRRWMELNPSRPTSPKTIGLPESDADKMQSGAVFLSYASEDRAAVIRIRDTLEQAGIDVWLDRNPEALRAGENFEVKIKTNIDRCSLFIPIISRNTLTGKARFFRTEWKHAQNLAERYPQNKRFIIPVAIDETLPDASEVPQEFRKLNWERIRDGYAPPEFVDEVKQLYRDYQRTLAEPA